MTTPFFWGPPGVSTPTTTGHRAIFLMRSETFLPQGRLIAGDASRDPGNSPDVGVLRNGLLMGKISTVVNSLGTVGYYAPAILDVLNGAILAGATSITISAAGAVELVRRCGASGTFTLTGPPTANGVVQSETVTYSVVNTTTGVITCTATANAYVTGSFVGPTDGSQTPTIFLPDWDYSIQVVDQSGASITACDFPKMPVSGMIDSTQLLPAWPTDTSLQAWIWARLNDSRGGQYVDGTRY